MGDDIATTWIVGKPMEIHIDRKNIQFIVPENRGTRKVAESLADLRYWNTELTNETTPRRLIHSTRTPDAYNLIIDSAHISAVHTDPVKGVKCKDATVPILRDVCKKRVNAGDIDPFRGLWQKRRSELINLCCPTPETVIDPDTFEIVSEKPVFTEKPRNIECCDSYWRSGVYLNADPPIHKEKRFLLKGSNSITIEQDLQCGFTNEVGGYPEFKDIECQKPSRWKRFQRMMGQPSGDPVEYVKYAYESR